MPALLAGAGSEHDQYGAPESQSVPSQKASFV